MASLFPVVAVEVELSGAGGGWTDLYAANDVAKEDITIAHGIKGSSPLDRVASTGTCDFALRNSTLNSGATLGYYSPRHASVRSGWGLGIGCRIRITDPDTTTVHTRFIGRIRGIDPVPGLYGPRTVAVTAVDWIDAAARWKLTPDVGEQVNVSWDQCLTAILAAMSSQPTATSFDGGTESYPYALDSSINGKQPALAEFKKIADSEAGLIYVKADGTLRAESRHGRMTSTASVWTLADTDYRDIELPSSSEDVINTVRVTTHPKIVDEEPTTHVYEQANDIVLADNETKILMGSYRDPVTGDAIGATEIQPLVAITDWLAVNSAGSDVTANVTIAVAAGASGVRFTVTNSSGAVATLTYLRLRAKAIYDRSTVQHDATDATSVTTYGENPVEFDMPYQANQAVGQGAADYYLARFKDPLSQARSVTVLGKTTALLTQILTRDISDRITLSETVSGVSGDYYINAIELTVLASGYLAATYTLTTADDIATYFEWDVSEWDGPDVWAPF
jgi:hypothetical protein